MVQPNSTFVTRDPGSYRDPAGHIVHGSDGRLKRVVTIEGADHYERYMSSGLHRELTEAGQIVEHTEEPPYAASMTVPDACACHKLLVPEIIRFISYPYEWSFDQLRDAALLTLDIQRKALAHGMSLKDAPAFNVQFDGCHAVFIDTLSFEPARERPWVAYEQFCRHFLGPLLLRHAGGAEMGRLLRGSTDGLPVQAVSALLPARSWLDWGTLLHVHLHGLTGRSAAAESGDGIPRRQALAAQSSWIESLRSAVLKVKRPPSHSEWARYSENRPHYSAEAIAAKREAVTMALRTLRPRMVFDLGANTGEFSRMANAEGAACVAFDQDPECAGLMYRQGAGAAGAWLLPLVMDLRDPSPALGFGHEERASLADRGEACLTLALGIAHHLRLGARVPWRMLAAYVARFSRRVLLEFVPLADKMANAMSRSIPRGGLDDYSIEGLCRAFAPWFRHEHTTALAGSPRSLLLFRRIAE